MSKKIKIAHVYTVRREEEIKFAELNNSIEFFEGPMKDEAGEYLFSDGGGEVSVEMEISYDGGKSWQTIYGDPR